MYQEAKKMVGPLDVFDQLIQTPLKLITGQETRRRESEKKYRRIKVDQQET